MISSARIWTTVDGRLVGEGDPDAAFLVVGANCEVAPGDEEAVTAYLTAKDKPAAAKRGKTPPNKSVPLDEDKSQEE